jgi:hypothetical protein
MRGIAEANRMVRENGIGVKVRPFKKNFDTINSAFSSEFVEEELSEKEKQQLYRDLAIDISGATAEKDIKDLVNKIGEPSNAHRSFDYAKKRKGVAGWSKDLRRVDYAYSAKASRYIALEPFKAKAVRQFERAFAQGKPDTFKLDWNGNNLAQYAKHFINDVNGNPSFVERAMTRAIEAFPPLHKFMQGQFGDRYALALTNDVTTYMTGLKLGLLNPSSAILQSAQLINVYATVNNDKAFFRGLSRAIAIQPYPFGNKSASKPTTEELKLLKIVDSHFGLDNASGYAVKNNNSKIKEMFSKSLAFFTWMDGLTRKIAILSSYYKAKAEGIANPIAYAEEIDRKANFDYSVVDAPELFRHAGPLGQILLQFKKYGVKELEFMHDLAKEGSLKQNAKFWIPFIALSGLTGLPGEDMIKALIKGMTDKDIEAEAKKWAVNEFGDDPMGKAFVMQMFYGGLSHIGMDVSKRTGAGDFLPNESSDFAGPFLTTIFSLTKSFFSENYATTWPETIKAISPTIGNLAQAYVVGETHSVTDRGRVQHTYTPEEKFIRALGFTPVNESMDRDVTHIMKYSNQQLKNEKARAIDRVIAEPTQENITKAKSLGVTDKQIKTELQKKRKSNIERAEEQTPKKNRKDYESLEDFAD